jgi:Fe-S cluster assembly protein SufD
MSEAIEVVVPAPKWLAKVMGSSSDVICPLRDQARAVLHKVRFPTQRDEEWRYTSLESLMSAPLTRLARPAAEASLGSETLRVIDAVPGVRFVFVDGWFSTHYSSPTDAVPGCQIEVLSEVSDGSSNEVLNSFGLHHESAFAALNVETSQDALALRVDRKAKLSIPLSVVHVTTAAASDAILAPRIAIDAGAQSESTIFEIHISDGGSRYFANSVTEMRIGDDAYCDLVRLQNAALDSFAVNTSRVQGGRGARGGLHLFSFGGRMTRNSTDLVLVGEGSGCSVNGLSALSGEQLVDNVTTVDHTVPHCESNQLFKGVYGGDSKGVFSGTIIVRPDAQKTNAYQSNQTLLLSPTATIDTRPQLKIWADDVKCTHGATVGQLDEKGLMYLRARGIGEAEATRFLVQAFAAAVAASVKDPLVRTALDEALVAKLETLGSSRAVIA